MKLGELHIEPYSFGLTRKLRSAMGELRNRRGLVLRAETPEGYVCHGEVAPLPDFSEETFEQAQAQLQELHEKSSLLDLGATAEAIGASLDALNLAPSVRHGVEELWLDGLSQEAGVSLARFLNPEAASQVETAHLAADSESALVAVQEGFRTIKLKVGYQEAAEDLRRVLSVREAVGDSVKIRLDANGAWTPGWAVDVLRRLAPLQIECIEQPVDADDIEGLAWVCTQSPIPVAADESVRTTGQVMDVLEKRAADIVVLKPMFCGGPAKTYELGRLAQQRGLKVMVTTALDSAIGRASALHVAAALDGEGTIAAGLDTGGWLQKDSATLPKAVDGIIALPEMNGLGLENVRVFA